MISYPNQKWKVNNEHVEIIKNYLISKGGIEDKNPKSEHELWRVRFSDATFTYYKSGTLFSTGSNDPSVVNAWGYIKSLVGSRFQRPSKKFLIGLDETGKGEVIGHTVLVGVVFPVELYEEIEKVVGVADTKKKHEPAYWDDLFSRLDRFKNKGLRFYVGRIPPWHVDRFNLNKIMDVVYQRILSNFARDVEINNCRTVLDDYGIGLTLQRFLNACQNSGTEIVVTNSADNNYLEAKVASLIAKREREKLIERINECKEFTIDDKKVGSGNAWDRVTIEWLKAWKKTGKEWPWFVKRSFKTVRELDDIKVKPKKIAPPIREDILSSESIKSFEEGQFSITTLSVVCPLCGERATALKLTGDPKVGTVVRCIKCKKEITNISITLRYYCGFVIPDSNAILSGIISKDLGKSRFFEDFTILLSSIVRRECDVPGGKKELKKLANFSAMGRIRLEEIGDILSFRGKFSSIERDELILKDALRYNAIVLTGDNNMKAGAQAKNVFTLFT